LNVEIQLIYINSSSIKAIFRIFEAFDDYRKKDQVVSIQWLADQDDDIMLELGEDFIDRFPNLTINTLYS
jgi:3'-phosphoadenosine 5'-phosphosulfate sulfotransferase